MPQPITTQFDPAVLAQARDATANLQLASSAQATGEYRLIYYATPGCGETHSYKNLLAADALPNVRLNYINAFSPEQSFPGAPGVRLVGNPYTGQRFNNVAGVINHFSVPTGYELSEANRVVLIGPNGKVVREFSSSTAPNFVNEVARLTGSAPIQRAPGAVRG